MVCPNKVLFHFMVYQEENRMHQQQEQSISPFQDKVPAIPEALMHNGSEHCRMP
jgi:hypothetical protein